MPLPTFQNISNPKWRWMQPPDLTPQICWFFGVLVTINKAEWKIEIVNSIKQLDAGLKTCTYCSSVGWLLRVNSKPWAEYLRSYITCASTVQTYLETDAQRQAFNKGLLDGRTM